MIIYYEMDRNETAACFNDYVAFVSMDITKNFNAYSQCCIQDSNWAPLEPKLDM
jgi:hypothetical protein